MRVGKHLAHVYHHTKAAWSGFLGAYTTTRCLEHLMAESKVSAVDRKSSTRRSQVRARRLLENRFFHPGEPYTKKSCASTANGNKLVEA